MSATQTVAYSVTLAVAGLMCFAVAFFVWQTRRQVVGARALTGFLLAMSWWDLAYAVYWTGAIGPTAHFWLDITYAGVVAAPALVFVFAYQMTTARPLSRLQIVLLATEPIAVLLLLFTDPWHNLFFAGQRELNQGLILHGGPVFWFNVIYSYVLMLTATVLLVRRYRNGTGIYRRQIGMILLGIGLTWLNSIVFILGFTPLPGADNTPFSFSIAAILFSHALIRYRLLDLVPVARDQLVEGMRDGLIVLDNQNRLLDSNRTAQQILDPQHTWQIGDTIDPYAARFPELLAQIQQLADGRSEITVETAPPRRFDLQISTLHDAADSKVGRLIVWRDITDLFQARTALEELNRALEKRVAERTAALVDANRHLREIDQRKDEFIARIEHELRTPLTNIKLYLHLLERATPEQQTNYLYTARQEANTLQDLIERLLVLPQLNSEDNLPVFTPISLDGIVASVFDALQEPIQAHPQPVVLSSEDKLPLALGDQALLYSALYNLVDNALKYAPQSTIHISTYIGHTRGQSWVCCDVSDEGPGLDAEDQHFLFERFYRGSAANTYQIPGLGMGLTLARQYIQSMGGDLTAHSSTGKGTKFTVRLKPVERGD